VWYKNLWGIIFLGSTSSVRLGVGARLQPRSAIKRLELKAPRPVPPKGNFSGCLIFNKRQKPRANTELLLVHRLFLFPRINNLQLFISILCRQVEILGGVMTYFKPTSSKNCSILALPLLNLLCQNMEKQFDTNLF